MHALVMMAAIINDPAAHTTSTSVINMKNILKVITIASVSGLLFATSSYGSVDTSKVKPVKTVQPMVLEQEVGKTIHLKLYVDENGQPTNIEAINVDIYDKLLAKRVAQAVEEWTFNPAKNDLGHSVGVWIDLPVHITDMTRS